ncbi:outer membrane receptor protein involved in Fe transport [Pontibacter ummariensis]|uniref:Outer membrane receptor proteins, mostly Fe transport n=1 Tax=Pontibacter ummariensis TaxID=1610492 RepID=A0A239EZZ4_9BACT|nr:outer membrane beta-barrel protein [Pontibacter ummariensis]PRY12663.1 outer membrane receptor protein involved in Fe transport [Pontibacter ummariensis]SNS50155.1 Outer membrane receptor proteins, mostly Fe transport [Pontibacter ummariensis]
MKQTLLLALCLVIHSLAWAQSPASGTIKGTVVDSVSQKPLGYVTVVASLPDKDEPIKTTFTQDKGTFEITGLPLATYKLILTYVGYKPFSMQVPALEAGRTVADLGQIRIAPSAKQLQEVEVTAEKMLITQDIDKISYNVEFDPESKTITALDMLRKVPMLSLDSEENIKLNGSGSFKVLVNGKASTLFARNPKDVFRSMPANTIKRIEVITDPPAKYDAEGIGGIINVITHNEPKNGYNGSVYLSQSTPNSRYGSANVTAKVGKFGLSAYGGTNKFVSPRYTSTFERLNKNTGARVAQTGSGDNESRFNYVDAEMSYELDTLNLFSAKFSLNGSDYASEGIQLLEELNGAGVPTLGYERITPSAGHWYNYEAGLDYQHTFKRNKNQLLTLSYKLGNEQNGSESDLLFNSVLNYRGPLETRTLNDGQSMEQTYQADYVHPFKKHTLEIGVKTILRDNGSDYFYRNYNPESDTYEEVPGLSNEFDYSQDIYAAYTSASLRFEKWGLRAGTRLEQTVVDANFKSSGSVAEQDYVNLIPSLTLTRTLKNMASLKASYTQRIERPSLYYLNPYVNRINEKSISYGNPNLVAATSHVFSLAHSFFKGSNSLNTTLTHAFTNNAIQNYTTYNSADSVSSSTYGNIGKNSTTTLSLSGNATAFKKLSLSLNGSLSYSDLSGNISGQDLQNSGISGYMYSYASYRFEKNWRASVNLGYYAPRVLLQGKSSGQFWNGVSVSKSFLKDQKASVSLSVQSPLNKYFTYYNELNGPDFYQRSENRNIRRRISIGVNYKFGKLKEDIKRTRRGIKNDDLKSGGDSNSSGGNGN